MAGLRGFLPAHAWLVVCCCVAVAAAAFFVPPSVGAAVGLTGIRFVAAVAAVELVTAVVMAAVFVRYRADGEWGERQGEYRFDP